MDKSLNWWVGLTVVSFVNVILAAVYYKKECCMSPYHRKITILCIVYAIVCCIRATFPVRIVERTCFRNQIITPFTDRVIATGAEMCFIVLLASITRAVVDDTTQKRSHARLMGAAILLIAMAQTCCWMGCATTNQLWNACEESLWVVATILLVVVWTKILVHAKHDKCSSSAFVKKSMCLFIGIAIVYMAYMTIVDVPMYIKRWKAHPTAYKTFGQGMPDMFKCQQTTTSSSAWKDDSLWRIGYFSGAVWVSMGIVVWYTLYEKKRRS